MRQLELRHIEWLWLHVHVNSTQDEQQQLQLQHEATTSCDFYLAYNVS